MPEIIFNGSIVRFPVDVHAQVLQHQGGIHTFSIMSHAYLPYRVIVMQQSNYDHMARQHQIVAATTTKHGEHGTAAGLIQLTTEGNASNLALLLVRVMRRGKVRCRPDVFHVTIDGILHG